MKKTGKTGPKAQTVKIKGDWQEAIRTALHKPKPTAGWPKPQKSKKKAK